MAVKFTNNAIGTLASAISNVETSITVSGDEGDRFPSLTPGDYFMATIVDEDGNREIVKVTARVGNTLTVQRGQEGTQARAFDAGSKVSHRLTAGVLAEFVAADELAANKLADLTGVLTTNGTATAYVLNTNQDFAQLTNGATVVARVHEDSGENPTLSVDALSAKPIQSEVGVALPAGALAAGGIYTFTYNSTADAWIVHNRFRDTLTVGANPDLVKIEALSGAGVPVRADNGDWSLDLGTTSINFVVDTGNSNVALAAGVLGDLQIDFACAITGVVVLADKNGNAVIDIWKGTYANYPPTAGGSICGSSKPTLSNSNKYSDTALANWIKQINAGDILRFNLNSVTNISRLTIKLRVRRYG